MILDRRGRFILSRFFTPDKRGFVIVGWFKLIPRYRGRNKVKNELLDIGIDSNNKISILRMTTWQFVILLHQNLIILGLIISNIYKTRGGGGGVHKSGTEE